MDFVGITTSTNLAYELVKQREGSEEDHEYEEVSTSHPPSFSVPADKGGYEKSSSDPLHSQVPAVPLPAQPLDSNSGGASGEAVYEHIPGDM